MAFNSRIISMQNDINLLLQNAVGLLQQGRLEEAGTFAQQAIAISPFNGDANLILGVVASQRGNHNISRAIFYRCDSHQPE